MPGLREGFRCSIPSSRQKPPIRRKAKAALLRIWQMEPSSTSYRLFTSALHKQSRCQAFHDLFNLLLCSHLTTESETLGGSSSYWWIELHQNCIAIGLHRRTAFAVRRPYVFSVAAGVPPAVEPGILPGGLSCGLCRRFRVQSPHFGRQDAALHGSQDGCRYS